MSASAFNISKRRFGAKYCIARQAGDKRVETYLDWENLRSQITHRKSELAVLAMDVALD